MNTGLDGMMVADPETLQPVPADGQTQGEVFLRGNVVMSGYLKVRSVGFGGFGCWFEGLCVWVVWVGCAHASNDNNHNNITTTDQPPTHLRTRRPRRRRFPGGGSTRAT